MDANLPPVRIPRLAGVAPIYAALATLVALGAIGLIAAWPGDAAMTEAGASPSARTAASAPPCSPHEGGQRIARDRGRRHRSVWM